MPPFGKPGPMLSPGDESPFGENRGGTPAGERARKRRAAQAAFPWCAPHAACVRARHNASAGVPLPFIFSFLPSSLPDNRVRPEVAGPAVNLIRQSMRTESPIGLADRAFRTAAQHGPPGQARWGRGLCSVVVEQTSGAKTAPRERICVSTLPWRGRVVSAASGVG